jgi:hypothetical protein
MQWVQTAKEALVCRAAEQLATSEDTGDGNREDIKEARAALVVLADVQQGRQTDTGGGTRGRWHAPDSIPNFRDSRLC